MPQAGAPKNHNMDVSTKKCLPFCFHAVDKGASGRDWHREEIWHIEALSIWACQNGAFFAPAKHKQYIDMKKKNGSGPYHTNTTVPQYLWLKQFHARSEFRSTIHFYGYVQIPLQIDQFYALIWNTTNKIWTNWKEIKSTRQKFWQWILRSISNGKLSNKTFREPGLLILGQRAAPLVGRVRRISAGPGRRGRRRIRRRRRGRRKKKTEKKTKT